MKKTILLCGLCILLLQGCSTYTPIIDTKGKAKFETSNASEISNDILHSQHLAKTNTTFFSNIGFWVISPKAETQYADIYRKCMQGRNHQVLN